VPDQEEPIVKSHLDLEDRVRRRAHEIWMSHENTGEDTALDDWLQAEREILGESEGQSVQDRATVVGSARRPGRVFGERGARGSDTE
jgi:hypothetical protein